MQVLDDQGRLFGRINIIDAAVLVVVCLLIPLSYSSYLLFRVPPARIVSIEPSRVLSGTPIQVRVRGEDLRPFLRVSIGTQAVPLLFQDTEVGVLQLPPLEPGSYDVVLYDQARELGRMANALVIDEYPTPPDSRAEVMVVPSGSLFAIGTFRRLDAKAAQALSQNLQTLEQEASPWGKVAGFRPPEPDIEYLGNVWPVISDNYQIRAVLQLRCALAPGQCLIQNVAASPGTTVPIDIRGTSTHFLVEELHPAYTGTVEIVVRGDMPREIAKVLADPQRTAAEQFPARDALRPTVVSIDLAGDPSDANLTARVRLRVPIVKVADDWRHRDRILRLGSGFVLDIPLVYFGGNIVSIGPVDETEGAAER